MAVNAATYRHRLAQPEVYFILKGEGDLHVDDRITRLRPGDTALIPAQAEQWIENRSDEVLQFLAICNPPWRSEDDLRSPD